MARIVYSRNRLVRRYEDFGLIDVPDELLEEGRELELEDYVDTHYDAHHEECIPITRDDEDLEIEITRKD